MTTIRLMVWLLFAAHLFPYLIIYTMTKGWHAQDGSREHIWKKCLIGCNLLVNTAVGVFAYYFIFKEVLWKSIRRLITLQCSYRDVLRLSILVLLFGVASLIMGFVINLLLPVMHGYVEHNALQRGKVCLYMTGTVFLFLLGCQASMAGSSSLELLEVCRKTDVEVLNLTSQKQTKEKGSYVLLRNNGDLKLEGEVFYLSDEEENLTLQEIPWFELAPGAIHKFAWTDAASLSISKKGNTLLYLSNEEGQILAQVEVPSLSEEEVYCKQEESWVCKNLSGASDEVPVPTFSAKSGLYEDEFDLEIWAEQGLKIYYTLDCSTPDEQAIPYDGSIHVYDPSDEPDVFFALTNVTYDYLRTKLDSGLRHQKAFVIRAVAVDGDGNRSNTVTNTYYFSEPDKYYEDQYIISLVADPEDLYGDEGIYVTGPAYDAWYEKALKHLNEGEELDKTGAPKANFNQHGPEWERVAQMEVFQGNDSICNQKVGIRIQGHGARDDATKRFSLYAREAYSGSNYFDVNLVTYYRQHSLVLRFGNEYAISQRLGQDRFVTNVNFQKVHVFINGEYGYSTYLCEKYNERNLAEKFHLKRNFIEIVKSGEVSNAAGTSPGSYWEVMHYPLEHDMANADNYAYYNTIIDMQSYIDMLCYHLILGNMDVQEEWNNMLWRTLVPENDEEGDGRWRWALYDMDLAWSLLREEYGDLDPQEIDAFTMMGDYQITPIWDWPVFTALRANPDFCGQFLNTFMDLLNQYFTEETTTQLLNDMRIYSKELREFFKNRPDYVYKQLVAAMKLTENRQTLRLVSNQAGQPVSVNTIKPWLSTDTPWYGAYFEQYPIQLSTEAENFSHWEVTVRGETTTYEEKTIEISVVEGGIEVHAVFE